jgi:hypothetical protein
MVRDFLESLSLGSGAAAIAIVSAVAALFIGHIRFAVVRWCAAVLMPFVFSYCCYWMPVWLGGSQDQYSSWEFLVVGAWFLAGLFASVVVMLIVRRYAARTI